MNVTVEQLQQVAQRLAQLEVQKDAELAVLAANLEKEREERAQDQAILQASLIQEREEREKEKAAHDEEMKKVLLAGLKNETDKVYFTKSTKLWWRREGEVPGVGIQGAWRDWRRRPGVATTSGTGREA